MRSLSFDPADPGIWKKPCYAYNPNLGPDENLTALGFNEATLLFLAFVRELRNTVVMKKLSLFVVVDGRHRAGKSQWIYVLSNLISRSFEKDPQRFIVKNAEDLLAIVPEINEQKIYNPVIIIDEAGSSLNSADWQERVMRAVIKTLAVIGYLHPTIFFIAPLKSQILKGIRDMCHIYMKVDRATNDYAVVVPYHMKFNSLYNKPYPAKFKINFFGQPVKLNAIKVFAPPKDWQAAYAAIEQNRKPILLSEIRSDSKRVEKPRRRITDIAAIVKQIQDSPELFKELEAKRSKPDDRKLNPVLIKNRFKEISMIDAITIKSVIEKGAKT